MNGGSGSCKRGPWISVNMPLGLSVLVVAASGVSVRRRFGFGLKRSKSCALLSVEVYSSLLFQSSRSPLL